MHLHHHSLLVPLSLCNIVNAEHSVTYVITTLHDKLVT
jgi:hypothetical protein